MSILTLTSAQFEQATTEHQILFIDFWATWCAPCQQFSRVFEKVAALYEKQVTFAKINVEEEPELAESFEILSIPHLMVLKQGVIIYSDSGSMPESTLIELVQQALSVDVTEIIKEVNEGPGE